MGGVLLDIGTGGVLLIMVDIVDGGGGDGDGDVSGSRDAAEPGIVVGVVLKPEDEGRWPVAHFDT